MRVLVTGGTGFIGSHSVAGLIADGHSVRLLVRDPSRVPTALGPLGVDVESIEVVLGDVTDAEAVDNALLDCDAVLHAASVNSFDSRDHARMRRVNAAGTDVVLGVAATEGVDPIVYVSAFSALLPTEKPVITPDGDVGRPRDTYMATKAEADRIARDYQDAGASVVITYPGATLGPHDPHVGDQLTRLRNVLRGMMPMWPNGGCPMGDVRDVARLHVAVMESGLEPRRLIAPTRYVSTREYMETLREVTGRSLPAAFLPAGALLPMGRLTEWMQRIVPMHIPIEYGAIYTCLVSKPVDTSATKELLEGGQQFDLKRSLTDAVRWLYGKGLISRRMAGTAISASAGSWGGR
ncbi:MAG TPA: NAD-dependent epimerase/dehydratase family protein [Actinocrinis sp.]|uniref:NAD-dependent epimerase/dehydratase family protein n=1 Tax=Actinocrinis sp. TaxID=1920516 RepID=UPI002DDD4451|nr:NAD-dependent epimerase/dehydratase family protein [Actinocrinis sp.]HEV2344492.1 NAD-dependent epimerase/dehydratase family protein [Actinocrinis sp.]